jgi:hypothetical protein
MSFKTILVHADQTAQTGVRLVLAGRPAHQFGGHLAVIYSPLSTGAGTGRETGTSGTELKEEDLELAKKPGGHPRRLV